MRTKNYSNVLAIGATGMLKEALLHLATQSDTCFAVSRNASTLSGFAQNIVPIKADYSNTSNFISVLEDTLKNNMPDLILLWVHSEGEQTLRAIMDRFGQQNLIICHVLGSRSPFRQTERNLLKQEFNLAKNCKYIRVTLGAMGASDSFRWLNNQEICDGVLSAIDRQNDQIIGQVFSE